ncbi:MAG: NAD-dependent epimerase/dehydratase family protein [Deltaproteobacteria bacterium]|nr:MAG: NAD-dependent epimerase/dehydratase family protein [Deltaproteobacteria bacterium]
MRVLVTGGTGFLGGHLIDALVARGDEVRALVRDSSRSRREAERLERLGVTLVRGDLSNRKEIAEGARGCSVVFHCAAIASDWGKYEIFHQVNVEGTRNVLGACQDVGVARLVHVSSPSVIFAHEDQVDVDESVPYPTRFRDPYCETKAKAEAIVLAANGEGDVTTTALRPHAIWGPRDMTILPRIAEAARRGRLRIIGNGKNRVSTCYVTNAVDALLLAAEREEAAGNAYFITDGGSHNAWEFFDKLLAAVGLEGPKRSIPFGVAYAIGTVMEWAWRLLPLSGHPIVTRYGVAHLARTTTYTIEKARRDLGYTPRVGLEEGLEAVRAWVEEIGGIDRLIGGV